MTPSNKKAIKKIDGVYEMENEIKFPDNAVVMFSEPLKDLTPDDLRKWLGFNNTETGLATAYAQVHNKLGWLGHELDDYEDDAPELSIAYAVFDEWDALDSELFESILAILKQENASGKNKHNLSVTGRRYLVSPFMTRNGFRDGAGWWVPSETSVSNV